MRTLLLLLTCIGLCQADTIFNVSASAAGQDCSHSSSTNAGCGVPYPQMTSPNFTGPDASSYLSFGEIPPLNGGPTIANEIMVEGQMFAEGSYAPGETTSGLATAQLSGSFDIPESWTNVYLIGGMHDGTSPTFSLTAGDQQISLPFLGAPWVYYDNGFPVPPAVIYHTPGTPETITFNQSVSADQHDQVDQFVFAFTVINAASVPEPASFGFLAAAFVLFLIAIGLKKRRT